MTDPDVLVAGETLVDFIPGNERPLPAVEAFSRRAGGAPANVAVALATLGRPPWFWTRVGTDPFGDFLADVLEERGVPDRFVERDPDAKTALAFVSHDPDADRRFSFYRDDTADLRIEPDTVPDDALETVEWVHVGGVLLADEPGRTVTLELMERARDRGCTVSFDPNARPELWPNEGVYADVTADALARADVVKATPTDLSTAGFGAEEPGDLLAAVCDVGPHTALLTLGDDGSRAYATDEAPWSGAAAHPGYAVDAVDTTGAGDAFTAGVIAALREGPAAISAEEPETPLEGALAFANALASATTTEPGAMAALPDAAAVREIQRTAGRNGQ